MTTAAELTAERSRFNSSVAPALVAQAVPGAAAAAGSFSSRFGFFEAADAFVIVAGIQEEDDAELALAYGLKLAGPRRLVLVLPATASFATRQRIPFLDAAAQPTLFHHDVAWGQDGPVSVDPVPAQSRQAAVAALEQRLRPGQGFEEELAEAADPKHLGADRSSAVVELVEWATKHPMLDPGHRRGERSWHCMGQKLLTIKGAAGKGLTIRAGIHFTKPGQIPDPVAVPGGGSLTAAQLTSLQEQVAKGIELRLTKGEQFHKPDEHWLQAVIRRAPDLVGVEQPALRELPAWRPRGADGEWGRGYVDLAGLDGNGDLRIVETKLAKNKDDLLIFQGLDYYVWAQAYESALKVRLGAAKAARTVVHYVIAEDPSTGSSHISTYAPAQAAALDIPWRCQVVTDWFAAPAPPVGGAACKLLDVRQLP
jgi:hypothetical protein